MTLAGSQDVRFGAAAKPLAKARGSDRSHHREKLGNNRLADDGACPTKRESMRVNVGQTPSLTNPRGRYFFTASEGDVSSMNTKPATYAL
jgi:hypothetical protein